MTMFRVGDWCVDPRSGQISRDGEIVRLDVRAMRLLQCLSERGGEVVSIDELLNQVWPEVTVSPDSVYQAVASLRRLLGDDAKDPTYITTVPRLGYRMVATVGPWTGRSSTSVDSPPPLDSEQGPPAPPGALRPGGVAWLAGAGLCVVLGIAFVFHSRLTNDDRSPSSGIAAPSQESIAVLPFLDLTEQMTEEPFADGMTEELIDRLSKMPGLRVPPPTSSFYFKGKQLPVADIAKALGVVYVLDGSVRKSATRLRVAARLIRADNGFVVWTETYDRSEDDILMVQDDIADEVSKALTASIRKIAR